jgi:cytochrome c553
LLKVLALLAAVSLVSTFTIQCDAADVAAGHTKAARCAVCHGRNGIATTPDAPNLAGQNEAYLVAQLTAFKSGERKSEMMSMVAKPLTDTDIANLAAYYNSLPAK